MANNTEMGQVHTENQRLLFRKADDYIDERWTEWRSWRRLLHAHPELSWNEQHTTDFIQRTLAGFKLSLRPGPRGMGGFVELGNTQAGELIALRGDIDAIPVEEANEVPYCSQFDGIMHACGHDVHTTVVLSVCDTIKHLIDTGAAPDTLRARAIFQPAEEVAQGATECIESGALENVAAILAMHVDSTRQVGELGLRDHEQTACSDEFDVYIEGTGGHGARPHETTDPIFAATQFINMAYGLVPRVVDARNDVVLCFCEISGGHSANVIPTKVVLKGTLRSFGEDARASVVEQLRNLAKSIGIAHGVQIDLQRTTGIPSVDNCPE
ncbi:MAG: M20 metallopeptidase family protein, partial [Pirellulaceae bacterium]